MVLSTVVDAFRGDPAWEFMVGDRYDEVGAFFAGALFDSRVDYGDVWVVDDGAAVSMWEAPDVRERPQDHAREVWRRCRESVGEQVWQRMHDYDEAVSAVRPATPHWYLGVLATRPALHGQGFGRAAVEPNLARADEAQLDTYLETSKPGNKTIYARLGFGEAVDVTIPDGPPTWWLRRTPR